MKKGRITDHSKLADVFFKSHTNSRFEEILLSQFNYSLFKLSEHFRNSFLVDYFFLTVEFLGEKFNVLFKKI